MTYIALVHIIHTTGIEKQQFIGLDNYDKTLCEYLADVEKELTYVVIS